MIRGKVQQGVVLLDDPGVLPEGTEVTVRPVRRTTKDGTAARRKPAVSPALLRLAGKAAGLPPDAARNVDHQPYGHRKR